MGEISKKEAIQKWLSDPVFPVKPENPAFSDLGSYNTLSKKQFIEIVDGLDFSKVSPVSLNGGMQMYSPLTNKETIQFLSRFNVGILPDTSHSIFYQNLIDSINDQPSFLKNARVIANLKNARVIANLEDASVIANLEDAPVIANTPKSVLVYDAAHRQCYDFFNGNNKILGGYCNGNLILKQQVPEMSLADFGRVVLHESDHFSQDIRGMSSTKSRNAEILSCLMKESDAGSVGLLHQVVEGDKISNGYQKIYQAAQKTTMNEIASGYIGRDKVDDLINPVLGKEQSLNYLSLVRAQQNFKDSIMRVYLSADIEQKKAILLVLGCTSIETDEVCQISQKWRQHYLFDQAVRNSNGLPDYHSSDQEFITSLQKIHKSDYGKEIDLRASLSEEEYRKLGLSWVSEAKEIGIASPIDDSFIEFSGKRYSPIPQVQNIRKNLIDKDKLFVNKTLDFIPQDKEKALKFFKGHQIACQELNAGPLSIIRFETADMEAAQEYLYRNGGNIKLEEKYLELPGIKKRADLNMIQSECRPVSSQEAQRIQEALEKKGISFVKKDEGLVVYGSSDSLALREISRISYDTPAGWNGKLHYQATTPDDAFDCLSYLHKNKIKGVIEGETVVWIKEADRELLNQVLQQDYSNRLKGIGSEGTLFWEKRGDSDKIVLSETTQFKKLNGRVESTIVPLDEGIPSSNIQKTEAFFSSNSFVNHSEAIAVGGGGVAENTIIRPVQETTSKTARVVESLDAAKIAGGAARLGRGVVSLGSGVILTEMAFNPEYFKKMGKRMEKDGCLKGVAYTAKETAQEVASDVVNASAFVREAAKIPLPVLAIGTGMLVKKGVSKAVDATVDYCQNTTVVEKAEDALHLTKKSFMGIVSTPHILARNMTESTFALAKPILKEIKESTGNTPIKTEINKADMKKSQETMERMQKLRLKLQEKNATVDTTLHGYSSKNIDFFYQSFATNSKSINGQDEQGNTALHKSINENDMKMVDVLVTNGADLHIQNKEGNSALSALKEKNPKMAEYALSLQDNYQKLTSHIHKTSPQPIQSIEQKKQDQKSQSPVLNDPDKRQASPNQPDSVSVVPITSSISGLKKTLAQAQTGLIQGDMSEQIYQLRMSQKALSA